MLGNVAQHIHQSPRALQISVTGRRQSLSLEGIGIRLALKAEGIQDYREGSTGSNNRHPGDWYPGEWRRRSSSGESRRASRSTGGSASSGWCKSRRKGDAQRSHQLRHSGVDGGRPTARDRRTTTRSGWS